MDTIDVGPGGSCFLILVEAQSQPKRIDFILLSVFGLVPKGITF